MATLEIIVSKKLSFSSKLEKKSQNEQFFLILEKTTFFGTFSGFFPV